MKALSTVASLCLGFSSIAFADHAVDNAREIARASYRAADAAEALEDEAYRDAGPFEDHRHDSLHRLAQEARQLHLSLSDLYFAARDAGGLFEDHRGDRIRDEYTRAEYDFRAAQRTYYDLRPYTISNRIHRLYGSVENTFTNLQWLVHGR